MNEEDHKFEKYYRNKFVYFFFIFFLLTRKDSITIHISEEGFDQKEENFFIQKNEWLMYAWLVIMYEISYVWISLWHFFENQFELIPISLLFQIHGIILLWILFFTFLNHFFGIISLLTNTFFNHFLWNTIWMTCMKLPRTWKGLDEVMKIN